MQNERGQKGLPFRPSEGLRCGLSKAWNKGKGRLYRCMSFVFLTGKIMGLEAGKSRKRKRNAAVVSEYRFTGVRLAPMVTYNLCRKLPSHPAAVTEVYREAQPPRERRC